MLFGKIRIKNLIALLFCAVILCGCSPIPSKGNREILNGFSVHYIDVGQGDCIFIHLPDQKNVVIDCGDINEQTADEIISFLNGYGVDKIDYFILTHPDTDHVGNAIAILDEYDIGLVYHPHVIDAMLYLFPTYSQVFSEIKVRNIEINVSDCNDFIKGDNYQLVLLTPYPKNVKDSIYQELISTAAPNDTLINDLSPIIYLEYAGVRFLFTGDAGSSQERLALTNVQSELFKSALKYNGLSVDLYEIDFLKVPHHGANDGGSEEFLSVIKPKNAVISVGGNNPYGHPTTALLERLLNANSNYKIFRTDVHGTVSVGVTEYGEIKTVTDLN